MKLIFPLLVLSFLGCGIVRNDTNTVPCYTGSNWSKHIPGRDSLQTRAFPDMLPGTRHMQPLWLANGIVVRTEELEPKKIDSVLVFKDPESLKRFNNLGINGVVSIKTRQRFKITTPILLGKEKGKSIKGAICYALNGAYLTDPELPISLAAIEEIELVELLPNLDGHHLTCINIWTLKKEERGFTVLCRGFMPARN